jgi:hypothetical protein
MDLCCPLLWEAFVLPPCPGQQDPFWITGWGDCIVAIRSHWPLLWLAAWGSLDDNFLGTDPSIHMCERTPLSPWTLPFTVFRLFHLPMIPAVS